MREKGIFYNIEDRRFFNIVSVYIWFP